QPNPANPAKNKTTSGYCIGKIEGNEFCPNKRGLDRLAEISGIGSTETSYTANTDRTSSTEPNKSESSNEAITTTPQEINLHQDLKNIDLQIKDYGEYAIVLENTKSVYERLNKYFSVSDSRLIYVLSVIYFVKGYVPASYIKDVYDISVLSNRWPNVGISENSVGDFLKLIGNHPIVCEDYSQGLISESSGLTAIDGHVILSCSKRNNLADYGNKYSKIGNKQINILEAYDVCNETPLTSKAYEGGLLDKTSVRDLLGSYDFPARTTFLIDAGFYSEDDMELYRQGGKSFVIPVPDSCIISKAIQEDISFTGSFVYTKTDEDGITKNDTILFVESTVKELEDKYQTKLNLAAELKNQELSAQSNPDENRRKVYARKIKRSNYGDDRIIMFRDEDMHAKMISEFREQMGQDDFHTEEKLKELGPSFGIIVLRTNLEKKSKNESINASETYTKYKMRWKLETHYNFVENYIGFRGLKTSDYYTMQGLSFLILIVGQIKAEFKKKLQSAKSDYVSHMSIRECLTKVARLKISQHRDKSWYITETTQKLSELTLEMGVSMTSDLVRLNSNSY
ncbi:MAG: hypothetical protein IJV19_07705, partial [Prevotella sp.]|nr:hypothetical protein [Prevotella sp.]